MTTSNSIILQAPGVGIVFTSTPSGTVYTSDNNSLVYITNGSVADQLALLAAGCQTLAFLSSTMQFQTLAALYAADTLAFYPQGTVVIVTNDGTTANDGFWDKTGTGVGAGNWTQMQQGQISQLLTAEANNAAGIAKNTSSIGSLQTQLNAAVSTSAIIAGQVAAIQATMATTLSTASLTPKYAANGGVIACTTAALPANTYNNGSSGVGATLTGNANGALAAVDGQTLTINQRVLVNNEATAANNGLYVVSQVGSSSTPYILTRATDANTAAQLNNMSVVVQLGTQNAGKTFTNLLSVATIGSSAIQFTQTQGGLEFRTSTYQNQSYPLQAADSACAAAGGCLVIDTNETLIGTFSLQSSQWRVAGGSITLPVSTAYNFTAPYAAYDRTADPYAQIFKINGTGFVYFSVKSKVSPCWFGANPNYSNAGPSKTLTNAAFQNAFISVNANPGSVVFAPPGSYLFSAASVIYYGSQIHLMADPGTVRFDYDPSTIVVNPNNPVLFCSGNPTTRTQSGTRNSAFPGVTNSGNNGPGLANCNFVTAFTPSSVLDGNIFYGVDFVHDPTPQSGTTLGAGKNCSFVGMYACYNVLVAHCNFIGSANDGINAEGISGTIINSNFAFNGFYADQTDGDTTRNGATLVGNMDVLNPELSTDRVRIIACTFKVNCDTGLATGGMGFNCEVSHSFFQGNQEDIECILYEGEDIKEWGQSQTVNQYDLLYVPGTTSNAPVGLGGTIWQYTNATAKTTAASGTGPVGTLGQTVSDGTATCMMVGYMPASGNLPVYFSAVDIKADGAIPAKLSLPWIGSIATPAALGGNGINGSTFLVYNSGNECHVQMRGIQTRNHGYAGSASPLGNISSNDGGTIDIDGWTSDNEYWPNSGSSGLMTIETNCQQYWGGAKQGIGTNTRTQLRLRNIDSQNIGGTYANSSVAVITIRSNLNYYDIEHITAEGSQSIALLNIEHSYTAASNLEYGRISRCYCGGTTGSPLFLTWKNGGTSTNGIDIVDNTLFNCNSNSGSAYNGFLTTYNNGTSPTGINIRFRGNKASYGGPSNWPFNFSGFSAGAFLLDAYDNDLNIGNNYRLSFQEYTTPSVCTVTGGTTPATGVTLGKVHDNGLPGESKQRLNSLSGLSGSYYIGDRIEEITPYANGSLTDYCLVPGTTGNAPSIAVTIGSGGVNSGTYTGTPVPVGSIVNFASGPSGWFYVTYCAGGVIQFFPYAYGAASGVALSYQPPQFVRDILIVKPVAFNSNNATGNTTLTAAQMTGGTTEVHLALNGTLTANATCTTDTAANIVETLVPLYGQPGQTYRLRIINQSSSYSWTLAFGTGVSVTNATSNVIPANTWVDYVVTITGIVYGSSSVTLTDVGRGTYA